MSAGARKPFAVMFLLLGVTVACSFGGDPSGGQLDTGETADDTAPAPLETAGPSAKPVTGNVGENGAPTFAEGGWTGGEAEVRITGSDTRTISGSLITESSTDGGTTGLIYAAGVDTISISISTEYLAFDITAYQEGFDVGASFGEAPCEVTYQEASDTRIEGTFVCEYAEIMLGPSKGPATMEGSFAATR